MFSSDDLGIINKIIGEKQGGKGVVCMSGKKTKYDEYCLTHSAFFEETFQMPSLGIAFLKKILPRKLLKRIDLEKLIVEKAKFSDDFFRETRPDIVYKVPIIGTKELVSFHVIIEHKSFDDHSAIYQIWKYIGQLCFQDVESRLVDPVTKKRKTWPKNFRLSPIIPIILHHGHHPFTGETQLVNLFYPLPGAEEYLPHLQAILVDLSAMEDDQLPRDPNAPELHVVLLIMKTIFSKDKTTLRNNFRAILDELRPYSQNQKYYKLIRKLWCYVVYNTDDLTESDYKGIETEIRETIGDNTMPTLAQMFIDRGMEQGIVQGMEQGIVQGMEQGIVQGMEQGKVEGKVEGKAESILLILTKRFSSVPKSLKKQILAVADLKRLDQLADFAFDCKSLAEFTKALK